jgi:RNA polymerase sigma-70 factor (ECF subfamily)
VSDDRDFDQAFTDCLPIAYAAAARVLNDPIAAEDAAAEAMARMYARWPRLRDADYLHAWTVKVATNVALDVARRRRSPQATRARQREDVGQAATDTVALADALRRLPRRQREAIVLCHLAGLTDREAAKAMNVTANTLRTHLTRGLAVLRVEFKDAKETSPSWTT